MTFSSWTSMDALQEATAKLQGLTASLSSFIETHQKLTPNQTIPDQIEELQEVWQCLEERLLALQNTPVANRQAHPACRSLLFEFGAIESWFRENDHNLRGFWVPQKISDGIESQRERSLVAFATRIAIAHIASQRDVPSDELESVLGAGSIDTIKLGRILATYPTPELTKAAKLIREERDVLDDGVADFFSTSAASALAQIVQTAEAAARVQTDAGGVSDLTQMIVNDFSLNTSSASVYRRASASTFDSPLDPASSVYRQPRSRRTLQATPEPPGGPPATLRTTGDSDGRSIADTVRTDPENATYDSTSSGRTRLAYLDYVDNEATASLPPQLRRQPEASTSRIEQRLDEAHYSTPLRTSAVPSSIIAFNARDALTNAPLIDPVLGSDGLIHDRWSLLDSTNDLAKSIEILGDVVQLREAIHSANGERRTEFNAKRAAYRQQAVEMCTSTDPNVMQDCVKKLSSVLQWKPDDVEAITRRGILSYRLRQLSQAKSDLDFAVRKSQAQSVIGLPNLDSLRYRCLVLSEIRDTDGALNDIDEIMKQTPDCPLTLSLRATIRAGKGDFEGARDDLSVVKAALEQGGGSQTSLADENRDLDLIAKAWTHSSLGEIEAAVNDFEMAQSLRVFDPYSVSCYGISLVHHGLSLSSQGDDAAGEEKIKQGIAELTSAVVVVSRSSTTGEELSLPSPTGHVDEELVSLTLASYAYDPFFLRGMANFALSKHAEALEDFAVAQRVRNKIVKDTGEFHCVLAILQAETGEYDAATRSFDYAMALKPEERDNYLAKRAEYGL